MHLIPNVWPTLACALFYFVFGGLWYAGILGKQWQAGLALSPAGLEKLKKNFPMSLAAHFISGLFTAYVIGRIVYAVGSLTFMEGLVIGLWCWIGFAFTVCINAMMFESRPRSVFWINFLFYLIAYAVIGGVMAVWR